MAGGGKGRGDRMWFFGAVLGAILAGSIDFNLAIVGALVGGVLAWRLSCLLYTSRCV